VEGKKAIRDRRSNDDRHGCGHHEQRTGARPIRCGNPVRQVKDDAGEEPGLGDAKEHASGIKRPDVPDEDHRHRHEAPPDQNPGDPSPGADAFEDQVARDFEQKVADEEQTGAVAVLRICEAQVMLQNRRCEPDVDAIDVGDHITNERERDEPACDSPNNLASVCVGLVK
jgi:hypothetical protein